MRKGNRRVKTFIFGLMLLSLALPAAGQPNSVMIEDLTWPEIQGAIAAGKTTAIYYAGSAEQNGPHMAIGKHNFVAQHVARRIAEELGNALAYPVMPYALTGDPVKKTGHMRFPGSVSLLPETFGGVAREVAESAIAAGFRNVFLLGDHGGGQDVLKKVAAELDAQWAPKGIRVRYVPDVYFKSQEQAARYLTEHGLPVGAHAGIPDTAQVMYLDHDKRWIRRDKLAPGDKSNGVDGDPRQATPELGKIFIQYKVASAVNQIRNMLAGKE
jgi:creatinine amidohydrolase/Fe(II)-dependent formamide hydrolase-like protein